MSSTAIFFIYSNILAVDDIGFIFWDVITCHFIFLRDSFGSGDLGIYFFGWVLTAILFFLEIVLAVGTLGFIFLVSPYQTTSAWFGYGKNKINIWYKIVKILIILKRNLHTVYIYTICEFVKRKH